MPNEIKETVKKSPRGQAPENLTSGNSVQENEDLKDLEVQTLTMEQIEEMVNKKLAQREENSVRLGGKLMLLEEVLGGEKKDKDTKQILIDPVTKKSLRYDTKYFATFAFVGGDIRTEITVANFESLVETKTYSCIGYIGQVKEYGNVYMSAKFTKFIRL